MVYMNEDGSITTNAAPRTIVGETAIITHLQAEIARLATENEDLRNALDYIAKAKYGLQGIIEDCEEEIIETETKNYYADLCSSYQSVARAALCKIK